MHLLGPPPIAARQLLHERTEHGRAQLSGVAEQVGVACNAFADLTGATVANRRRAVPAARPSGDQHTPAAAPAGFDFYIPVLFSRPTSVAYALAQRARGRTADAIVAHALTNALIAVAVLAFGADWLWA